MNLELKVYDIRCFQQEVFSVGCDVSVVGFLSIEMCIVNCVYCGIKKGDGYFWKYLGLFKIDICYKLQRFYGYIKFFIFREVLLLKYIEYGYFNISFLCLQYEIKNFNICLRCCVGVQVVSGYRDFKGSFSVGYIGNIVC